MFCFLCKMHMKPLHGILTKSVLRWEKDSHLVLDPRWGCCTQCVDPAETPCLVVLLTRCVALQILLSNLMKFCFWYMGARACCQPWGSSVRPGRIIISISVHRKMRAILLCTVMKCIFNFNGGVLRPAPLNGAQFVALPCKLHLWTSLLRDLKPIAFRSTVEFRTW